MIIAVDGPSASGKGTLARRLAAHYGLPHLDTGLLYRAVGRVALDQAIDLKDEAALAAVAAQLALGSLEEARLRTDEAAWAASRVAALPSVRAALLDLQQRFAAQPGGAVLDGRDTGTVIAPQADVKLFVTASAAVRAARRLAELRGRGVVTDMASVRADIDARDARDSGRAAAPLRQAENAHLLDTSELDIDAAFRAALALVEAARDRGRASAARQ